MDRDPGADRQLSGPERALQAMAPAAQSEARKKFARHRRERAVAGAAAMDGQMLSSSAWLNASLLAINSGGAVATLSAGDKLESPIYAGACFSIGIVFAMLSATLIQTIQEAVHNPMEGMIDYWTEVEICGEPDEERQGALSQKIDHAHRHSAVPPALGWVSGVAFMVGVICLGASVTRPSSYTLSQCTALQRDMGRLEPKRTDSRELFIALKCPVQAAGPIQFRR
ncbi:hypothetical protein [Sphingomonas trueperi]|uniref:hypothetical protein n=1 Tax=Sphingomonas trueperi TaxID=53317 RepID=UPI000F16FB0C